jgi:hypothetical protein
MRILAESRPVAAMPFVHLGYLAASYFRPLGGWPLTGCLLLVACVGMVLRRRKSKMGAIGKWILLVGILCAAVAWMAGTRHYPHGDRLTSGKMERVLGYIETKVNSTPDESSERYDNPIRTLPTKPGVYDLGTAVQNGQETRLFTDGWRVRMELKVIVTEGQEVEYVLMSAGEDREWGTDDDFTSRRYAAEWNEERAQLKELEAQRAATPSSETTLDSRQGDHPE